MLSAQDNETLVRVGPGTPMGEVFRRYWMPVMLGRALPGPDCRPLRVRVLGEELIAFRDSLGEIGLIDAFCPHRMAPMYLGRNEHGGMRCAYHGIKFDRHGTCTDYPGVAEGAALKRRLTITSYPVCEKGGVVWAYMGPAESKPEPPDMSFTAFAADDLVLVSYLVEANWLQVLEGDFDMSHIPYLHSLLSKDNPGGYFEADGLGSDVRPTVTVFDTDFGLTFGTRWSRADGSGYNWRVNQLMLPSNMLIPVPGGHLGETSLLLPIDDNHSMVFIVWHSSRMPMVPGEDGELRKLDSLLPVEMGTYQFDDGVVIDIPRPGFDKRNGYGMDRERQCSINYTGLPNIKTEDQAVVEGMGYIVDRSREHLNATDRPIIALRNRFLRMARNLQQGIEPNHPSLAKIVPIDTVSQVEELDELLSFSDSTAPV